MDAAPGAPDASRVITNAPPVTSRAASRNRTECPTGVRRAHLTLAPNDGRLPASASTESADPCSAMLAHRWWIGGSCSRGRYASGRPSEPATSSLKPCFFGGRYLRWVRRLFGNRSIGGESLHGVVPLRHDSFDSYVSLVAHRSPVRDAPVDRRATGNMAAGTSGRRRRWRALASRNSRLGARAPSPRRGVIGADTGAGMTPGVGALRSLRAVGSPANES
jgi:hypothetical protein